MLINTNENEEHKVGPTNAMENLQIVISPSGAYVENQSQFNDPSVRQIFLETVMSSDSESINDDDLRSLDAFTSSSDSDEMEDNLNDENQILFSEGSPLNLPKRKLDAKY